jgi:hypothetical protein
MSEKSKAGKESTSAPDNKSQQILASGAPVTIRRDATPTIFADGLLGGSIESGVVRLELLARHLDPESKSISSAVVGRLVIPAERFAIFVAAVLDLANKTHATKE